MNFNDIYKTATAAPFLCDESYVEIAPCPELQPYIKCFWGSRKPYRKTKTGIPTQSLIIPDTCMDIIFEVNFTENRIGDVFCALDERPYFIHKNNDRDEMVSTFAVRFYAWGAAFFTDDSLKGTKNSAFDTDCFFAKFKSQLAPKLFDVTDINERTELAQRLLLKMIHLNRENRAVNDAVAQILLNKGNVRISTLAKSAFTGSRQLERLFNERMGVSPKTFAALVRYQCLWQEVLFSGERNAADLSQKYGYSDEAHMLNDFKKHHGMTIPQAKKYAGASVRL